MAIYFIKATATWLSGSDAVVRQYSDLIEAENAFSAYNKFEEKHGLDYCDVLYEQFSKVDS